MAATRSRWFISSISASRSSSRRLAYSGVSASLVRITMPSFGLRSSAGTGLPTWLEWAASEGPAGPGAGCCARRGRRRSRRRVQVLAEPAEPGCPEAVQLREPSVDITEPVPAQRVVALAPGLAFGHDAGIEHQAEMLGDGWPADRQAGGELGHPCLAASGQPLEELAPQRVRDHAERIVDGGSARSCHGATIGKRNLTCQALPDLLACPICWPVRLTAGSCRRRVLAARMRSCIPGAARHAADLPARLARPAPRALRARS